jgi:hypothetical protein
MMLLPSEDGLGLRNKEGILRDIDTSIKLWKPNENSAFDSLRDHYAQKAKVKFLLGRYADALHDLDAGTRIDYGRAAWKGRHSFRRGLASNLYELGVSPKIIQGILRRSDIGTTLSYYVQVPEEESRTHCRRSKTGL